MYKHKSILILVIFAFISLTTRAQLLQNTSDKESVFSARSTVLVKKIKYEELETTVLKQNNDTLYVVNFWATWCRPCVKELPYFEKLNNDYQKEKLKVILVSMDFPSKIQTNLIPFIERKQLKSQVFLLDEPDGNSWISKVNKDWSGAIPATVFVKNGSMVFKEGVFEEGELETKVDQLIK